ncbi:hypothetical protein D3C83_275040 [compost metagenome]
MAGNVDEDEIVGTGQMRQPLVANGGHDVFARSFFITKQENVIALKVAFSD